MNQRHSMKLSVFRASTSWNSHRTQKHSATALSRRLPECSLLTVYAYGICSRTDPSGYFPLAMRLLLLQANVWWHSMVPVIAAIATICIIILLWNDCSCRNKIGFDDDGKKENIFWWDKNCNICAVRSNPTQICQMSCLALYILASLSYNFIFNEFILNWEDGIKWPSVRRVFIDGQCKRICSQRENSRNFKTVASETFRFSSRFQLALGLRWMEQYLRWLGRRVLRSASLGINCNLH